jgi:hypothetical protein
MTDGWMDGWCTAPHHYVENRYIEVGFSLPSAFSTSYNVPSAVTYSKRIPLGVQTPIRTHAVVYTFMDVFSF